LVKDAGHLLAALARSDSTVLLVDEQSDTREIAGEFFRELGCRVVAVGDLHAAAQLLRSMHIDLIIARYPDERAQSAAATLRVCSGKTPIIALATNAETLRRLLDALGHALRDNSPQAGPN
jgi:CheY-like chemotaxis protein